MEVVWKPIPGYEGIYEVSSDGRVRTSDGKVTYSVRHGRRVWAQRVLKTKETWSKNGKYFAGYRVALYKDKKCRDYLVHRLEACAFYGEPLDTKLTVNHKDGDRRNNRIENLEFLSRGDNIRHGFATGLYPSAKRISLSRGKEVHSFNSMSQASRFLGRNAAYISTAIKSGQSIAITPNNEFWRILT